ncbi:hypothetical protein ETD86_12875 [Nonomuraea turkmeniaca]|uniref:Uncharacterized protein n=1 Tax=Nonomuraea turkmeniaca TaxID=103838 RepID=A0A5S4FMV4_9ACTN|nr:hypothetical protein [Nonomuraea turkmeniaca]TMR22056.1 hypothetical protein ETD86_12875 [Nonomuraea turkmeniaca]
MSRMREIAEARKRLAPRYGEEVTKRLAEKFGYEIPAVEAVTNVADAARNADTSDDDGRWPAPTPEDVDDALLSIKAARVLLLEDELTLIEAARANNRSWNQIGKLLGIPVAAAKTRPEALRQEINKLSAPW